MVVLGCIGLQANLAITTGVKYTTISPHVCHSRNSRLNFQKTFYIQKCL